MKSKKGVLLVIVLVIISMIGVFFIAVSVNNSSLKTFEKGGYVIQADSQSQSTRYQFTQGTQYEEKYPNKYAFEDNAGEIAEIESSSFLHYEDGSISALSRGVLMNFKDLEKNGAINHYGLPIGMILEKSGKTWQLESQNESFKIEEGILKISDSKFVMFSENIEVVFDKNDIRKAGDFIEINYIDEGVVQLVTQDNVWQSVSTTASIKNGLGTTVKLFDQVVEKNKNQMTLNKLVVDADSNIELSPLEKRNQQVPKFDIKNNNGTDGEAGELGVEGTEGTSGDNGNKGTHGTLGTSGTQGSNGTSGNNGDNGTSGTNGKNGTTGKPGVSGSDAGQESSSKTGLPQFSIQTWEVDAISLKGSLKITDENVMLTSESAKILVYEAGSGTMVSCLNENGESDFNVQGESISFHTDSTVNPLKPDTEYRLVLTATYEMNEQQFQREFVSRVFYTDSLGLFMEKDSITTSSVKVKLTKNTYSKTQRADIYLLTSEESKNFDVNSTSNYIKKTVDMGEDFTDEILTFDGNEFDKIKSNQKFVVRLVAFDDEKTYITQQVLQVMTLKKKPSLSDDLYAIRNKPLKCFELYSGVLKDDDNSIIEQYYEVYDADENSSQYDEILKTIAIEPGSGLQAVFLPIDKKVIFTSHPYRFRMVTTYNDNEKIIEVKSKFSETFKMSESYLPALSMQPTKVEHDYISGNLIIDLNGSTMDISAQHPLIIHIDCEGDYAKTIEITSKNNPIVAAYGNQIILNIAETGLKADSVYRFRVNGYVDLKDGDGSLPYVLGNVVTSTTSLSELKADWKINNSSSNSVARILKLDATDGSWTGQESTYQMNALNKITLDLYKGSGNGKVFMGSKIFTDVDKDPEKNSLVDDFIINGKEVSEIDFGFKANSLTGTIYTIRINTIYDTTGSDDYVNPSNISRYKNQYNVTDTTREVIVTKANQAPALPDSTIMNDQVKSTIIYNKDVGIYGKTVDSKLDDNAIVGYRLEANYDNYAKLARKMYYYAFESNQFANLLSANQNPIYDFGLDGGLKNSGEWVVRKEIAISPSNSNVPVCAIFFGEGVDTTYGGVNVTYSGKAEATSNALSSGMSRGYKYNFAYALSYSEIGAGEGDKIYPYEHPQYAALANKLSTAYVLNSGIKDAPKIEPKFTIYPSVSNYNTNKTSLTLKYRYSDNDKTIKKNETKFLVNGSYGDAIDVDENTWGSVTFNSIISSSLKNGQFIPQISRQLYNLSYKNETNILDIMYQPIDFSSTFNNDIISKLKYNVVADLEKNQIKIELKDPVGSSNLDLLNKKIAGVNVRFYDVNNPTSYYSTYMTLNASNIGYISTAKLDKLIGKTIGTDVSLCYDSNNMSWELTNRDRFALQYITKKSGNYVLGNYIAFDEQSGAIIKTSTTASGSIFTLNNLLDYETIQQKQDFVVTSKFRNLTNNYSIRADQNGMAYIIGTAPQEQLNYFVVKKINETKLVTDEAQNFELTKIVPSISVNDSYGQNMTSINLYGVDISGVSQIDADSSGKRFIDAHIKNLLTNEEIVQSINVTNLTTESSIVLNNLKKDTSYRITFTAKVNKQDSLLLDAKKSGAFMKEVKTKGSVNISSSKLQYKIETYDVQRLVLSYNIDQVSGFFIRYSILDEFGNVIMSNQDMINAGMYDGYKVGDNYQTNMNPSFMLNVAKHKLKNDTQYQIKTTINQVTDGKIDESIILGTSIAGFKIAPTTMPITFTNLVPEYHQGTKTIDMKVDTSVADNSQVIMSDYLIENGYNSVYYVRYFEKEDSSWKDVTAAEDLYKVYDPGKNYTMTLKDLKPNTNYRIAIYASIDMNRDGICDNNPDVKGSIASLDHETFEKDKEDYLIWEDVRMTPGENGIAYGDVTVENPNRDPSKIAISYKNASNLNSIKKVEYTVISSDGKSSFTGVLMNENGTLFSEKLGGYYTMELPLSLENLGYYRIMINYYLQNGDVFEKTDSYSTTYLYEK
ncbi:MAG: hypothetical protein RR518_00660 [Coprobacillus sp.]